jgi:hypothetical protein
MRPLASANITSSGARVEIELLHDVRTVGVHRSDRDEELSPDLLVRVAERKQLHDVSFPLGERLERGRAVVGDEPRADFGST